LTEMLEKNASRRSAGRKLTTETEAA
jgi:hypothetical protein